MLLLSAVPVLAVAGVGAAQAKPKKEKQQSLREAVRAGRVVPLGTIMDWIAARYRGQVIEVEIDIDDDRLIYEVELLTEAGHILEFEFLATDGTFLEVKGRGIEAARIK